jgi:succinyl-CoA synthetase beta subunit
MLKALVLTGGRGKQGGVRRVESAAEARTEAARMFGLVLGGYPVEQLLVEAAVPVKGAAYLGVTLHPRTGHVTVLASFLGGVDIERAAVEHPEAVRHDEVPGNDPELPAAIAGEIGAFLAAGLSDREAAGAFSDTARRLYRLFQAHDAKTAEINPLLLTPAGAVVAADARIVLDDNALYRQAELLEGLGLSRPRHDASEPTRDEVRAREAGFPYLDLLPEDPVREPDRLYVGLVPGGAGYGIFSIDEVANVGEREFAGRAVPVNFMDSGGGPSVEKVAEMFHLLMDKEIVDVIVTSRFGGISSCDIFIRGLVACLRARHADGRRRVPVAGRMVGTDLPGARAFLEKARGETPEALSGLDMLVGNEKIMVDVIRDALAAAFRRAGGGR